MTGTPQPKAFRIDAGLLGGTVTLDGTEIDCLDYEVISGRPDRPARLILHVAADGIIEGEGIVTVVRDAPTGDQVRALDAQKIRAAFAAASQGMGQSAAGVYRDVIADMLDAQAGGQ